MRVTGERRFARYDGRDFRRRRRPQPPHDPQPLGSPPEIRGRIGHDLVPGCYAALNGNTIRWGG